MHCKPPAHSGHPRVDLRVIEVPLWEIQHVYTRKLVGRNLVLLGRQERLL